MEKVGFRIKKILIPAMISVLIALTFAGCSFSGPAKEKAGNDGEKVSQPSGGQNTASGGAGGSDAKKNTKSGDTSSGTMDESNSGVKRDSGRYVGQIDNNFIEIKISGVPDNIAARSFMLGDRLKEEFEKLGLKTGNEIGFTYRVNDNGQMVISEIKKL